jgi:hypothetical protein
MEALFYISKRLRQSSDFRSHSLSEPLMERPVKAFVFMPFSVIWYNSCLNRLGSLYPKGLYQLLSEIA